MNDMRISNNLTKILAFYITRSQRLEGYLLFYFYLFLMARTMAARRAWRSSLLCHAETYCIHRVAVAKQNEPAKRQHRPATQLLSDGVEMKRITSNGKKMLSP